MKLISRKIKSFGGNLEHYAIARVLMIRVYTLEPKTPRSTHLYRDVSNISIPAGIMEVMSNKIKISNIIYTFTNK